MDPFQQDTNIHNEETILSSSLIEVWHEKRGRKTNTYISGWLIPENEMKDYLKEFKKKHGCNGSIQQVEDGYRLHVQGDKIDDLVDLMVSKGVDRDIIKLKGV